MGPPGCNDYSGKKPSIVNRLTGEETPMELFVSVLGASSYVYAEASASAVSGHPSDWFGRPTSS